MDMKRILQAMDGVATKPVAGANDMARFLRAVKEADINQSTPQYGDPKEQATEYIRFSSGLYNKSTLPPTMAFGPGIAPLPVIFTPLTQGVDTSKTVQANINAANARLPKELQKSPEELSQIVGGADKPYQGPSINDINQPVGTPVQEDSPPAMPGGASDSGSKSGKAYEYQMKALQDLLTTESEPWKQHLTKWRIKNLETNGVTAFHTDYNKNAGGVSTPIKVLDSESWLKKNPSLAKQLPPECLPPVPQAAPVQQPGILDKIKKSWNDWEPAYKRDADNLERSREEQGLGNFGGAAGTFIQKESANDMTKFLSIVDKNASIQILHEGKDPHKVTLPVQMAMQHYQKEESTTEPQQARVGRESVVRKYFDEAEQAIEEEQLKKKNFYRQYAQTIAERVLMKESKLDERSTTEKQARTMAAAAHNPAFAKKVGIDQKVAKEFNQKDKGTALLSNAMKGKRKKVKENEISGHSMGFNPTGGPGMGNYVVDEAPLEFDKENPSASTIHSHQGVNPASIEARIMRARSQLKDLAERAQTNDLLTWEHIARQFPELAMNVEQIRHGIEELAKIRKQGGRRTANIPKHIGETNPIKEANAKKKTLKNSNPCWKGYHPVGTKQKGGRTVPNCVPKD